MAKKISQIKGGAIISYVAIVFNIVAGLLYTPWMVRILGKSDYALYSTAIALVNLFLIDFGIGAAVSKYIARFRAEGKDEEADYFYGLILKFYFIISLVILIALVVIYFNINFIYAKFTPDELKVFKVLFLIAASYNVISFPFTSLNGVMIAYEKFIAIKLLNLIQKVITVALIIVMLVCGQGVLSLVVVNAVVNIAVIGVKLILVFRLTPLRARFRKDEGKTVKEIVKFSCWITVAQVAQRCIFSLAPTLLASAVVSEEIAFFTLAASIEGYVYTFSDAINGMFLPRVTVLVKEGDREGLTKLVNKVGRLQTYLIGLICIGFVTVGARFVNLWLGSGYYPVYLCAVFLIIPSFFDLPQQIMRTTVLVEDKIKYQGFVYLGMAVLNVILVVVLARFFGVVGAAVSVCVSYMVRTIGMNFIYSRSLKMDLKLFYRKTLLPTAIPFMLLAAAGVLLDLYFPLGGWTGLGIIVIIMCLFYFAMLYFGVFNREEKDLVHSILWPFKRKARVAAAAGETDGSVAAEANAGGRAEETQATESEREATQQAPSERDAQDESSESSVRERNTRRTERPSRTKDAQPEDAANPRGDGASDESAETPAESRETEREDLPPRPRGDDGDDAEK